MAPSKMMVASADVYSGFNNNFARIADALSPFPGKRLPALG
jgi:hypothetical protein